MTDEIGLLSSGRLRWACRRGMLELDILLETFLDNGYEQLSDEQKSTFETVLGFADQDIFELCMGQAQADSIEIADVIKKICLAVKA